MLHAFLSLLAGAWAVPAALGTLQDAPASEPLTLDACIRLSRELRARKGAVVAWMPDGQRYLAVLEGDGKDMPARLALFDAKTGESSDFFDAGAMQRALSELPGVSPEEAQRWSRRTSYDFTQARDGMLLSEHDDLYFWRIGAQKAARLTFDPDEEVGATLSPDGRLVAYIHDWNLHVVPTEGGSPLPLTRGGDENHLYGRLDWVYQEEVYGRGNWNGFWWSPNSRRLAFLILDESAVPTIPITDSRETHPKLETWRYPKAGDPNPKAELAVVDAAGGDMVKLDLSSYAHEQPLIVRVGWTPDGAAVVFQVQNRVQTWLDVCLGDPATGKVTRLFRESTPVWTEPNESPTWLPDGQRFVWRSERDGFAHLYLYQRDGTLLRRLTEGPFEVDAAHGVDAAGDVWFDCDRDDVKGSQLYRVSVEGGEPVRVTKEAGSHSISMSPTLDYFVDSWSSAVDPGRISVHDKAGERLRVSDTADVRVAQKYGLMAPEFVKVPTRDGFEMEAMLIKPKDFDPGVKWPVLCYTYGGPHAPQVRDTWASFNTYFHQMLAQEGFLIWVCDNRTASGKGLASVQKVYKNFGALELADLEDGLDWLVAQGFADPARIGLWGWSFGGYMTSYALTHSTRFKIGIAGAPVTQWNLYDSIYTERYMDTPQANPEGYASTSVLGAADKLSGKLLLIHGEIDENVHVQNTLMLVERLQKAGKLFDLMIYPGNRHPVVQRDQRVHLYTMMADFIRKNL